MTLVFTRVLKYRLPMMSGPDVEALQRRLVAPGHGVAGDIDGLYGPTTRDLVKDWQKRTGLKVDGEAGRGTITSLNEADTAAPRAAAHGGLNPDWLPPVAMKRIILHWTGGAHRPSSLDRKHYHFLIDADGGVHRGNRSIADNVSTRDGLYAAHTRMCNTGSIGVAVCAMAGAHERPFRAGTAPMTRTPWEKMAELTAGLCRAYGIACTPQTVLGHGEVQDLLGKPQKGKWDPLVLPWRQDLGMREVGNLFRTMVAQHLAAPETGGEEDDTLPEDTALVEDARVAATRFDARDWLDLDALVAARGWPAPELGDDAARIETYPPVSLPVTVTGEGDVRRIWVEVPDVVEALNLELAATPDGQISLRPPMVASGAAREGWRPAVVRRGDTLSRIAGRELGAPARWREIRKADGPAFDETSARSLSVGRTVLIPVASDALDASGTLGAPALTTGPADVALSDTEIDEIADGIGRLAPGWLSSGGKAIMMSSARVILETCRKQGVLDPSHIAYVLATANHETNLGRQMVEKWGPTAQQRSYLGRLGNATLEEAERYLGRGFVQLTGKSNYARYAWIYGQPFDTQPELLEKPEIAALVLVEGMRSKGFVSPSNVLAAYGFDGDFDFFDARDIVNRDKKRSAGEKYPGKTIGAGIADVAEDYAQLVRDTQQRPAVGRRLELTPTGDIA